MQVSPSVASYRQERGLSRFPKEFVQDVDRGLEWFMPDRNTSRNYAISCKNTFLSMIGDFHFRCEDVTGNIERTSGRWYDSRQKHRDDLLKIEGEERFGGLQKFLSTVHKLTSERRLSRFVFLVEKS